jgi:2-methylcitrate dehydratase PrpD
MKNGYRFIHKLQWEQIPHNVQHQAKRCFLDTLGAAIAGTQTVLSKIIYDFAHQMFAGQQCHLWLDGRTVSPIGAALAHSMTIDSLDIHDNCNLVKGHAGVALVPTLLALLEYCHTQAISGQEFLTSMIVGYEVAIRSGIALHKSACDYHSSGAWNALGCAAMASRWLQLDEEQTHHALGIAEYHGPRSQMMRCIDHPTMVKDGSGWGAMTGLSAAFMAKNHFTGAPALTVESENLIDIWTDMGNRWYLCQQDFKRHAVCHWAQPAIAGILDVMDTHQIVPEDIKHIRVFTFYEATRLHTRRPCTTEEAQYSLPFAVAAACVFRQVGFSELSGHNLENPKILHLIDRIELLEDDEYNVQFPERQMAHVQLELLNGQIVDSQPVLAPWDVLGVQATDDELCQKFHWLVKDILSTTRSHTLEQMIWKFETLPHAREMLTLLK